MEISNSPHNTPYSQKIQRTFDYEIHALNDDDWLQFLKDHKEQIKENSVLETLTEEVMYIYRYRIRDYLRGHGRNKGMEQAFRIVNRLYSDLDFDLTVSAVYIPMNEYLNELRQQFNTNRANYKRIAT